MTVIRVDEAGQVGLDDGVLAWWQTIELERAVIVSGGSINQLAVLKDLNGNTRQGNISSIVVVQVLQHHTTNLLG